jgi:hypothetical protein
MDIETDTGLGQDIWSFPNHDASLTDHVMLPDTVDSRAQDQRVNTEYMPGRKIAECAERKYQTEKYSMLARLQSLSHNKSSSDR